MTQLYSVVLIFFSVLCSVEALGSVNQSPLEEVQPDGSVIRLFLKGHPLSGAFMTDDRGHPVVRDKEGWYVYASHNHTERIGGRIRLLASQRRVGEEEPESTEPPDLTQIWHDSPDSDALFLPYDTDEDVERPSRSIDDMLCEGMDKSPWCPNNKPKLSFRSDVVPNEIGVLNMIVVLVKFSDHLFKELPSRDDYDVLFNTLDNVEETAPTGSLKKFYQTVSLGRFSIESTVEEWITIDGTEEDVGYGQHGLHDQFPNIANEALKRMDDRGVDWNVYDKNGDGELDAVFIVHSGYGGETGGTDCYNNKEFGPHRIWSHRGYARNGGFVSANGNVRMGSYVTASGLANSCGSHIVRLGSICHEFGHLLGIPDMVGKSGNGVGTWDVMGLLWGADGSQYLPGMFGAYSRQRLGWAHPQRLTTSGWYRLRTSAIYGDVYRVDAGFPDGEYLLIENRQAVYYDKHIPSTGLMIWHIDENVDGGWQSRPGWPGQEGWPYNGNHYHVSILQADGLYDLEKGINNGGVGDLFAGQGVGLFPGGPFPNSDGYSGGFVFQSGVTISDISESSDDMTFRFSFPAGATPTSQANLRGTQKPSAYPTATPILPTLSPSTNVPTLHPSPYPTPYPSSQATPYPTLAKPTPFPTLTPTDMHKGNLAMYSILEEPTPFPTIGRPTFLQFPSPSEGPAFPTPVPSSSPSDQPPITPGPIDFSAFANASPLDHPPTTLEMVDFATLAQALVQPTQAPTDLPSETIVDSLDTVNTFLTDLFERGETPRNENKRKDGH